MRGVLLFIACACCGIFCRALTDSPGGRPLLTAYSAQMFNTGSTNVWGMTQAADGTLYFGTNAVLEFDGARWKPHSVGNTYAVRAMAFDKKQRLWIGAFNEIGFFERGPAGLTRYQSLVPKLPAEQRNLGAVWHLYPDPETAAVVFVAEQSVLRWDGQHFETWSFPNKKRLFPAQAGKVVYFHHQPSGLYAMRRSGPELVIPASLLVNCAVLWLEETPQGLLLATSVGFFYFCDNRLSPFAEEITAFLRANVLSAVTRLPDGKFVIGTVNGGIAVLDPDGRFLREFTTEDGLPHPTINYLFVDRDGDLWAANLSYFMRIPFHHETSIFDRQDGLGGQTCWAITRIGHHIAVATSAGISISMPANLKGHLRFGASQHRTDHVQAILGTDFGLVVGERRALSLHTTDFASTLYPSTKDILSVSPAPSNPHIFYFSALKQLMRMRWQETGQTFVEPIVDLPDSGLSTTEATDGTLWVGAFTDTFVVHPAPPGSSAPASVAAVQGLPAQLGLTTTARVGDRVVVLTPRGGFVAAADGVSVQPMPELAGLKCSAVSNRTADGGVWFAASRIEAGDGAAQFCGRLFPRENGEIGVKTFEIEGLRRIGAVRSLFLDEIAPATLWIGGSDGLLKLDPARLRPAAAPRVPLLTTVQARREDGAPLAFAEKVPFAANRLSFTFSSTDYARAESLRFQTRLLGADHDWAPLTGAAPCEYLSLHEGDYRFQVRALSASGLASEPAEWRFTVLPPWYRTLPAYAGYAGLGLLALFGGVHLRLRAVRRRNRELERLVRQRTAELEQANAAKTQFVARINHDIRNPINGVLGLALALGDTSLSPRQRKLTASLQQCARFLASLVEEVLDFAQLESSRDAPLKAEPFDLAGALTAAHATAQAQADELGCRIAVDLDPKLPTRVIGDAVRLQRIIVNFLSNAVKYGGGPTVELSARVQQLDPRQVLVRVSVRDYGPGISDEEQPRLFNQFFRGRHAREQKIKGSGLGLAVCRLLAESMGGSVGVESALGHGSLFHVTLPFALDLTPASAPPVPPSMPIRVLVVEDEEYNAIATTAILRRLGYTATLAKDGRQALALLRAHRFDVAFVDWDLPYLNGGEVARQYRREEPADRHTLLIATTAFATEEQRQACFAAGMDGFVAKPLTPERIAAALRETQGALQASPSIHLDAPPAASEPQANDFDLALFHYLTKGSPSELARRLREYLDNCESELLYLRRAVDAGDCTAVRKAIHRLLNQSTFIGADRLSDQLRTLHQAAREEETMLLPELCAAVEAEYRRLSSKLAASPALRGSWPPRPPAPNE